MPVTVFQTTWKSLQEALSSCEVLIPGRLNVMLFYLVMLSYIESAKEICLPKL